MSGTWSSSWLAVRPCSQKTLQCGSKTWRDTSTSTWQHQRLSPRSAATLTVGPARTWFCSEAKLEKQNAAHVKQPWQTVRTRFTSTLSVFVSRLPILPYRERAEGYHQGPHWTLQWHSARSIRPLCLYDAQGAGQTVRYCTFRAYTEDWRRCGQKRCRHVILNHPVSTKRTILKSIWWSDICKRQLKKTNRQKTQRPSPPPPLLFAGEPLHGYRVCIQAILQDKPKIVTQNLPEVSAPVSRSDYCVTALICSECTAAFCFFS